MAEFKGILNENGLSGFNQYLFESMSVYADIIRVIDLRTEQVEVLIDRIDSFAAGRTFTLAELRERFAAFYRGNAQSMLNRYSIDSLSTLRETTRFDNPEFSFNNKRIKLTEAMTPEFDEEGRTVRVYVTCVNGYALDSTRQKDLETKAIFEHFVQAYSAAYTVNLTEDTYEVLYMDPDFAQVFTMNGGREDMERFVENHVHPDDRAFMRQMIRPDYVSERLKTENEISFTLRQEYNGIDQTLHALIMKGTDEFNAAVGFMDVTSEVQREQKINEQLEAANKAKKDFLSSMSHDIRTPMNAIIGMIDIALRHTDDPEKMVDCLKKIRTSGGQLTSLVNDVLDISAIESGKTELRLSPHNVEEGMAQMEATILGVSHDKNLTVEFKQHDIVYPWIIIDEMRLEQIINNLLSNAIKYTPSGGSISFDNYQEINDDGTMYGVITVADTGIGMTEEFMEHMWDTFSRATDTRINKIQGAGLGLSIVKNFVDLMDGTIDVESELNKGTTFTLRIPFTPAAPEQIPNQEAIAEDKDLHLNILVAEDNDLNWEIANDLLEMHGVSCTRAENGQIAVDAFLDAAPKTFDAILMDMQMPIMDGIEATVAIRASRHPEAKTIPIIALTANAFVDDIEQCKEAGMNDHLSKPIEIDKMLAVLRSYSASS